MIRSFGFSILLLAAVLWHRPAAASFDMWCEPSWTLVHRDMTECDNMAFLAPGNDTRVNLLMLNVWRPVKVRFQVLNAQEAFMIWLKAALMTGLVIASPYLFYQIWIFVAAGATTAYGQTFPTKPIRLIIPFAPGGTTDIVGRGAADQMSRILGQPVVVENRAGGGGSIGADAIAKAAPDGYTIGISTVSTMAVNPACNPKLSYDPIKDFKPITNLANVANVIAVNPNFPAKDYKEFLAVLKANPGKYSYASSGTCGFGHMLGEQFKVSTKTFMVHIPYRGAGPALAIRLPG